MAGISSRIAAIDIIANIWTPDAKRKLLRDNAMRVYGLKK